MKCENCGESLGLGGNDPAYACECAKTEPDEEIPASEVNEDGK